MHIANTICQTYNPGMKRFWIGLLFALFMASIFATKTFAFILYVPTATPTPNPTPTSAPIRYYALPTPTPTVTQLHLIVVNSTPTPTPTTIKYIPISPTTNTRLFVPIGPHVTVTYPPTNSVALNGQVEQYTFTVTGLSTSAQYQYRMELWRNGSFLGYINHPQTFTLDTSSSSQSEGDLAGRYWPSGATKAVTASEGSGYTLRAVVMQNGKDVGSAYGNTFSYTSGNYAVNPKITITSPNGGESYAINGAIQYIEFSYSGMDPYKNGNYWYQVYLYKDGKQLGPVGGVTPYELNTNTDKDILGYLAGDYYDNGIHVAQAGRGYTMKIIVTYKGQTVASDSSDNTFSFTASTNTNPPAVHVLSPNGGEVIPMNKLFNVLFEQKNLDPYFSGSYTYLITLLRNGTQLGYIGGPTPQALNDKQTSQDYGFKPQTYFDPQSHTSKNIVSGGGYTLEITVFKKGTPILTDVSDGSFSFGQGATIYLEQVVTTIKESASKLFQLL
jgi:hypothetical protein